MAQNAVYKPQNSHMTRHNIFVHIWVEHWSVCTYPVRLVIRATKLCTMAPNIFSLIIAAAAAAADNCDFHITPELWVIGLSLLHVTLLARRIWRWLLYADCCVGYQNSFES